MSESNNQILRVLWVREGLQLRGLEDSNAIALFNQIDHNRTYLRKWLPWLDGTRSIDDSLKFIQAQRTLTLERKSLVFGIFLEQELVGSIGTHLIDWTNRKTSIGYWIAENNCGMGLVRESARCLIEYLMTTLNLHRITISCATGNMRSRRVAESLNFQFEGVLLDNEFLYDQYVDHAIYSLLNKPKITR